MGIAQCGRCGRLLKSSESVERGYGPECWEIVKNFNKTKNNDLAALSDYAYHINSRHGWPVLVIEDLNLGGMSVTNNAEAIIAKIADEVGLTVHEMPIVYRDSEGVYDGISDKGFYALGETSEDRAVAKAIERRSK